VIGGQVSGFSDAMLRARKGDSAGFDWLFNNYAGRIRAFALSRNARDAEAISNDVLLRVFQNLGTFEGDESKFTSWIFTIAANRLVDAYRFESRRPELVETEVPEQQVASSETEALDNIVALETLAYLQCLTSDQRDVISLRMVADLSLEQVAEILGKPVSAVKALQRRGLRRLRKEISSKVVSR
jgi:RNA polymerase sigma-70 factor (ECF subfamily)